MIIGTAGHVDHGKSALVEALTGRRMDPLPDERRRGITLDLHVAALPLDNGATAGVVDVPGHEDLVRTMIAGASGIDLVLLVIAANEGIMPQTREHLLVLEELGIPRGIPVVTKSDLVEPAWLDLVRDEVAEWLSRSPVSFSPPVVVSARTGEGIAGLREAIDQAQRALRGRAVDDLPRLPVDRVLSIPGVGTVLAGTVASGSFHAGDIIRLLPSGLEGRVRSVERHGGAVAQVIQGERAALAVAGIDPASVHRGEVAVSAAGVWGATRGIEVVIRLGSDSPITLRRGGRVRLALGTAEVLGRLRLTAPIVPGESGVARLALESPLVARGGDRFVLRSYSPVRVIGGGTVIDSDPPAGRTTIPAEFRPGSAVDRLALVVSRSPGGLDPPEAIVRAGVTPGRVATTAAEAGLIALPDLLVSPAALADAEAAATRLLREHHEAQPGSEGIPLETLRAGIRSAGAAGEAALQRMREAGLIRVSGGHVAHRDFAAIPEKSLEELDLLLSRVRAGGLTAGTVEELAGETGSRGAAALLRRAEREGLVVAVERNRFVARTALEGFANDLARLSQRGPITPAAVRELTGLSRKHLIPLLEWADREGLTIRSGDARLPGPKLPSAGRP